ncbi:SDR family NAD(P)-dependent oxidoreductase [Pedosphaera parvula]|uniref:Short-chain dehydrogenase/reductase SDR n=1 Tax=Pedosphaera parvula (strain Ellin514) TaxID=320771 RepID=B9XJ35_PEDPL|nr:glucose 1-dehydrogenase [Pedosphaera parvula]EEF60073.1 short-chain dehydrogenase/reductase SDR [Pedosphaera parvula Ellin514]
MSSTSTVPNDFRDKVVLVTGAGSGIGREAARSFAARGALVYCADINDRGLAETQSLITKASGKVQIAHTDVSVEEEVSSLLSRIDKEAGRLDVAFNNAGITGGAHRIEEYPMDDFDKVLRVNLKSVFLCMKYELPLLKRGGGGAICNTASVAAITGPGGMCAYAASKHAVLGLTRVAAMENAAHKVRVNALVPGWTDTPMVRAESAQNPAFAKHGLSAIPAKRGGQPSEVAAAAVWLCSSEASYVMGQMIVVDGGMTIGGFEFE